MTAIDGKAVDFHAMTGHHMENTELGCLWSPLHRDLCGEALMVMLLAMRARPGQRYGPYRGIEVNCVAVLRVRERLSQ